MKSYITHIYISRSRKKYLAFLLTLWTSNCQSCLPSALSLTYFEIVIYLAHHLTGFVCQEGKNGKPTANCTPPLFHEILAASNTTSFRVALQHSTKLYIDGKYNVCTLICWFHTHSLQHVVIFNIILSNKIYTPGLISMFKSTTKTPLETDTSNTSISWINTSLNTKCDLFFFQKIVKILILETFSK